MQKEKLKRRPRVTAADIYIGKMIRLMRNARGWNLRDLARAIGVSYQQVQKYEAGRNRISAISLLRISRALGFPIETFLPNDPDKIDTP